ncbi:unnamed protein product, partial [Rotaria sordida]
MYKAAAEASFLSSFGLSANYDSDSKYNQTSINEYKRKINRKVVSSKGGEIFILGGHMEAWQASVKKSPAIIRRAVENLTYFIQADKIPELTDMALSKVRKEINEAVNTYMEMNTIRGCMNRNSPSFNWIANLDDGSCASVQQTTQFGGFIRTCTEDSHMPQTEEEKNICFNFPFPVPSLIEQHIIKEIYSNAFISQMIDEDSTFNISNSSEIIVNDVIPKIVGFWLYIIFLIPSIICSFIIISYLLFHRPSRNALNNHVILVDLIIGLISELTLYPSILYYYRYDGIWHRSRTFCAIWSFIDSGLYVTQMVLVCWASIERHILIFHSRWMMTKKKLFFIHYLPLILILLYCMIYYSIAHFFPPCENYFDDSTMQCCYLCFYDYYALFMWEMIAHEIIPSIIIVISSITLIVRVSWQKHR